MELLPEMQTLTEEQGEALLLPDALLELAALRLALMLEDKEAVREEVTLTLTEALRVPVALPLPVPALGEREGLALLLGEGEALRDLAAVEELQLLPLTLVVADRLGERAPLLLTVELSVDLRRREPLAVTLWVSDVL